MGLFNFKNEKKMFNGVVFTCRHFMDKGERVTYISHKENGDYECFCDILHWPQRHIVKIMYRFE